MLNKSKFVGLAAVATLWAGPALADTQTYTMNLTATVGNICRLPSGGSITSNEAIDLTEPLTDAAFITGSKTFEITCTSGLNYTVDLENGGNFLAADGRRLKGPGATPLYIPYKVYKQLANTSEWAPDAAPTAVSGTGGAQSYIFSFKSTTAKSGFPAGATGTFTDSIKFVVAF
jgi:spore coat protein U-like protein